MPSHPPELAKAKKRIATQIALIYQVPEAVYDSEAIVEQLWKRMYELQRSKRHSLYAELLMWVSSLKTVGTLGYIAGSLLTLPEHKNVLIQMTRQGDEYGHKIGING